MIAAFHFGNTIMERQYYISVSVWGWRIISLHRPKLSLLQIYCIFLSQISLSYTIASNYLLHLEEIFWFPVNSSSNLTKRIQTNANKNFSTLMFYRAHIIQNSLRLEIKGTNPQLLPKFYVQKCRRERFFGFEFIIKIYLIEFHKTPLSLSNRF